MRIVEVEALNRASFAVGQDDGLTDQLFSSAACNSRSMLRARSSPAANRDPMVIEMPWEQERHEREADQMLREGAKRRERIETSPLGQSM